MEVRPRRPPKRLKHRRRLPSNRPHAVIRHGRFIRPWVFTGSISIRLFIGTLDTMAISATQVKELRDMTGAGFMECKAALSEADANL